MTSTTSAPMLNSTPASWMRQSLRTIHSTSAILLVRAPTDRLLSRFEEIHDEEPAESNKPDSKKRPRESDEAEGEKLSKTQQKKLNKKLKAEGGKAVAAGEEKPEAKGKAEEKKQKGAEKEKTKEAAKGGPKEGVPSVKSEVKTVAGDVKYQDHKVGTGKAAKAGDMVFVRYVGKLTNGKVFDSNTKGQPVRILRYELLQLTDNYCSSSSVWARARSSRAGMSVSLACNPAVSG